MNNFMKIFTLIIISFILSFTSCIRKKEEDKIKTVYNLNKYMELYAKGKDSIKNIKTLDTFCINQTKRAKIDIKNNKLIYFMSEAECEFVGMKKHLKKLNIDVKNYDHYCVIMGGFRRNCYEIQMWKEIDNRLGEKFIDSLKIIAEKEFIIDNPDSLYIKDGIDIRNKYPNLLNKNYLQHR